MRKFSEEYNDIEFVQQVVAQIPWSHNYCSYGKN